MNMSRMRGLRAITVAGLALLGGAIAMADTNSAGSNLPAKGKYAQLNKLPDWSGVWNTVSGYQVARVPGQPVKPLPYKGEYATRYAEIQRLAEAGTPISDPTAVCNWPGMPRLIWQPYGMEILFTPGRVTMLWTIYSMSRRIYTDGRKFPEDLDDSYNGLSIGHWEGDTLVAHTKGLRGDTNLDNTGAPHSSKMEVTERWRLVSPDRMEVQVTLTDPEAFSEPYRTTRYLERKPDWDIGEYSCFENNRSFESEEGFKPQ